MAIDDERLREMVPLISTTWLFDTIPKALDPGPALHNSDGEEVVFHRVRFPFARGATQALIGARLDAIPALQRENARFWNWLGARSVTPQATGRLAWGVTMEDGTPVLGNVELKGRAVILAVTSAERAERGIALLTEALGDRVGSPLTEIETLDQAMAARRETLRSRSHPSRPRSRPRLSTPCSIVTIAPRSMSPSQCWATSPPRGRPDEGRPRSARRMAQASRER